MELSFWLVHGRLVFFAVLASGALAGALLSLSLARRLDRARDRELQAALGELVSPRDAAPGDVATFEGTIEGAPEPAEPVDIRVQDTCISIDAGWKLGASHAGEGPLRAGDVVRARGPVRALPAAEHHEEEAPGRARSGPYRRATRRLAIGPDAELVYVGIGRTSALVPGAKGALGGLIAVLALAIGLGSGLSRAARAPKEGYPGVSLDGLVVLAMIPWQTRGALRAMDDQLAPDAAVSRDERERRLAHAEKIDRAMGVSCTKTAQAWLRAGFEAQGIRALEGCKEACYGLAGSLVGEVAPATLSRVASRCPADQAFAVRAALRAGELDAATLAASKAHAVAGEAPRGGMEIARANEDFAMALGEPPRWSEAARAFARFAPRESAECMTLYARIREGDQAAVATLEDRAKWTRDCALLLADLPAQNRIERIHRARRTLAAWAPGPSAERLLAALEYEAGEDVALPALLRAGPVGMTEAWARVVDLPLSFHDLPFAIVYSSPTRYKTGPRAERAEAAATLALYWSSFGDHDRATAMARTVDLSNDPPGPLLAIAVVRARARDVPGARSLLARLPLDSGRTPDLATLMFALDGSGDDPGLLSVDPTAFDARLRLLNRSSCAGLEAFLRNHWYGSAPSDTAALAHAAALDADAAACDRTPRGDALRAAARRYAELLMRRDVAVPRAVAAFYR